MACSKSVAIHFGLANTEKKYKYVDECYEAMYMKEEWEGQDKTPMVYPDSKQNTEKDKKKDKKAWINQYIKAKNNTYSLWI